MVSIEIKAETPNEMAVLARGLMANALNEGAEIDMSSLVRALGVSPAKSSPTRDTCEASGAKS